MVLMFCNEKPQGLGTSVVRRGVPTILLPKTPELRACNHKLVTVGSYAKSWEILCLPHANLVSISATASQDLGLHTSSKFCESCSTMKGQCARLQYGN